MAWQLFIIVVGFTIAQFVMSVNVFIQPIAVERAGNEAMLNFGLALALEAPAFTFPRAINLPRAG